MDRCCPHEMCMKSYRFCSMASSGEQAWYGQYRRDTQAKWLLSIFSQTWLIQTHIYLSQKVLGGLQRCLYKPVAFVHMYRKKKSVPKKSCWLYVNISIRNNLLGHFGTKIFWGEFFTFFNRFFHKIKFLTNVEMLWFSSISRLKTLEQSINFMICRPKYFCLHYIPLIGNNDQWVTILSSMKINLFWVSIGR